MKEPAVVVTGLHKEFVLPQHKNTSLKQAFVNIGRRNKSARHKVLDGINFEVSKGDFFGIVGRNGSGKSTLLKILAGVYAPSSGSVQMNGNLTPFIELGVGFNPELSGRDNVFLNGALLGFNRKEMSAMYDEIVEFAELSQFMDQKLKNYSSGMQVRLAFSIAVKAKNDILIFDEVLAVGDEAFQRKCIDIFEQYKASGQTIILVTHDMETVKKFCNKAILISDGKIIESGNPRKVANHYSDLNQSEIDRDTKAHNKKARPSHIKASTLNAEGKVRQAFELGQKMTAAVSWSGVSDIESVGVNIFKESGEHVTGYNTNSSDIPKMLENQAFGLEFALTLTPGKYYLLIEMYNNDGHVIDALIDNGPRFSVIAENGASWSGLIPLEHSWKKL